MADPALHQAILSRLDDIAQDVRETRRETAATRETVAATRETVIGHGHQITSMQRQIDTMDARPHQPTPAAATSDGTTAIERRRWLRDPAIWLRLGMVIGGIALAACGGFAAAKGALP
jgi:hypothetical protein